MKMTKQKSQGGIIMKKLRSLFSQKQREELLEKNKDVFFDAISR